MPLKPHASTPLGNESNFSFGSRAHLKITSILILAGLAIAMVLKSALRIAGSPSENPVFSPQFLLFVSQVSFCALFLGCSMIEGVYHSKLYNTIALRPIATSWPKILPKIEGKCLAYSRYWGFWCCVIYFILALLAFAVGVGFDMARALPALEGSFRATRSETLYSLFFLGVLTPFGEEIFFRGSLLRWKNRPFLFSGVTPNPRPEASSIASAIASGRERRFMMFWSIYLSSIVFWIFHLDPAVDVFQMLANGTIPLPLGPFLLGLCCGWLAWKDNCLFFAMVFHGLANVLGPLWRPILENVELFSLFYF